MRVSRPLNYYGSKERMCPVIHGMIPPGMSTWVDVFCGSAIVTLCKPRHPREVINDLNDEVINLFDVLRGVQADDLLRSIELTPFAQGELLRVYAQGPVDDPVEKARRFLIASWFGRGGDNHKTGFRWSKGSTVAPELAWARLPKRLESVAERLRGVCIRKEDALKIIDDYDAPDCILFVDPPYPGPAGRRYAISMSTEQHEALALRLCKTSARVIITMSEKTIYDDALADWWRHAASVVTNGGTKPEVIFTNFEPSPLLNLARD
ncbi:MAG: hypothetical protein A2516_00335 [Alphaproteobacteria bacterium RIFOXYD12_FULL_60_8]|nr:MAG: hypothetical protein A2516_00335 [Alphaproteobacteria bacterium RIFOXYD12_FULL_60_8]